MKLQLVVAIESNDRIAVNISVLVKFYTMDVWLIHMVRYLCFCRRYRYNKKKEKYWMPVVAVSMAGGV